MGYLETKLVKNAGKATLYPKIYSYFYPASQVMEITSILQKKELDKADLVALLTCSKEEEEILFRHSRQIRDTVLGNGVYLRGLIEISNICTKDCLYCGIRQSNRHARRYRLEDDDIAAAAEYAWRNKYGSIVLQGGERTDAEFTERIGRLVQRIKTGSNGELGITLSLGEQSEATYRYWRECGAHRYLLRIETSNPALYRSIHPDNGRHDFQTRLNCLRLLQQCGYQTGTGVMIGLPAQTAEDLADDLLFFKEMDIDMVGMGPYLEHRDTPLWAYRDQLLPQSERLTLALRMVSCLRILMPDINVAATTALQAIDPHAREKALQIGANVIMPNITPQTNRADYRLYENKPGMDEGAEESTRRLIASIQASGCEVKTAEWGDSRHFHRRTRR